MIIIEEMDQAISHLIYKAQTYVNHDKLKAECFDDNADVDVEAIIIQLRKYGFLHGGLADSPKDFKLTVEGRLFWQNVPFEFAGRPFAYKEHIKQERLQRDLALLERSRQVDESVITTNRSSRNTSRWSLVSGGVSVIFILATFILQSLDRTAQEVRGVKEQLRNQSVSLKDIRSSLESTKTAIQQATTDTFLVRKRR